ncbi:phage tail assembly chaperone [Pseudomonas chlororaphis]|uniref:phage tail assembly chaperone n=1 Tax=Pseudomonas chlororaphis TaxID=587753 RepID=UPI000F579F52|nr:phage tail assembly chaperone [Pseudomonas chlororaphis]WDG75522.1 phage tail assembly chaperone [Pseudomonas chlororaphis]WDH26842.1 phage tail assembly chaperone [Pseudomonas chlororaphis]WDH74042.1 phage tail assembly chaperone [Pseudomonas chlororaphis]
MAVFYHLASRSFLDTATYSAKSIPADAVEITRAEQVLLLDGESSGRVIIIDEHGRPSLVDPAPNPEAIANQERWWRDAELERVAWIRERHRDELELSLPASVTADQYSELLAYMQLLRDWPQSPDFPDPAHRPVVPGWIEFETQ